MIDRERVLRTFLDYVQIDSETHHEGAMTERLAADLRALGLEVYTDKAGRAPEVDSDGANVYCFLEGEPGYDAILFSAHMDTVTPGRGIQPYLEDGYIRTRGDTVLGADDKSGVAAIMEALRCLVENGAPHRPADRVVEQNRDAVGGENEEGQAGHVGDQAVRAVVVPGPGEALAGVRLRHHPDGVLMDLPAQNHPLPVHSQRLAEEAVVGPDPADLRVPVLRVQDVALKPEVHGGQMPLADTPQPGGEPVPHPVPGQEGGGQKDHPVDFPLYEFHSIPQNHK